MAESAAAAHVTGFLAALREAGIAAPHQKQQDFLQTLQAAPPATRRGLYWQARITLTGSKEEIDRFDSVFETWFGEVQSGVKPAEPDSDGEEVRRPDSLHGGTVPLPLAPGEGTGQAASADDLLNRMAPRRSSAQEQALIKRARRAAERCLPRRPSLRLRPSPARDVIDLRRMIRAAARHGGELIRFRYRARPMKKRPVLLFVDVSGSLKGLTPDYLRFARALGETSAKVEVFSFGTRLTRLTDALLGGVLDRALRRVATKVEDFEGGTQIGRSLTDFFAHRQYAGLARGAVVIILSDGLERGDPALLVHAVRRLRRLAERLVWLTPLKRDADYRPVTRAMAAVAPTLDHIGGAASLEALAADIAEWTRS
ncbi:vWA domain-containing protein [Dongia sedimenti]|uniref:VWA domain-containing protein n=1 Tax=Dongia sedimenti TaxID=3064282 RepID=A0ABU0YQI4_9PROT|nr:VWA domain-containing protein [Rhodospirillaceae bacterium R-7]